MKFLTFEVLVLKYIFRLKFSFVRAKFHSQGIYWVALGKKTKKKTCHIRATIGSFDTGVSVREKENLCPGVSNVFTAMGSVHSTSRLVLNVRRS